MKDSDLLLEITSILKKEDNSMCSMHKDKLDKLAITVNTIDVNLKNILTSHSKLDIICEKNSDRLTVLETQHKTLIGTAGIIGTLLAFIGGFIMWIWDKVN